MNLIRWIASSLALVGALVVGIVALTAAFSYAVPLIDWMAP